MPIWGWLLIILIAIIATAIVVLTLARRPIKVDREALKKAEDKKAQELQQIAEGAQRKIAAQTKELAGKTTLARQLWARQRAAIAAEAKHDEEFLANHPDALDIKLDDLLGESPVTKGKSQ